MPSSCCCVPGCSNRKDLRFPNDKDLRKQWMVAIRRTDPFNKSNLWEPSPHSIVCYSHFKDTDFHYVNLTGGLVSYVSPAYGGSTSDRQIVELSELVSACDPGDSIMADKGFNVQDIFAQKDVTINIPTFFSRKNRMSTQTVMKDRKISSKRVHIERIIGLAKTFKILTSPLNSTETRLATEIISVCFMLCRFKKCIVPTTS